MGLHLSDDQLNSIANQLFLLKSPPAAKLPVPANTDDTSDPKSLASRLAPIGADERFKDMGIGVVDFTQDLMNPRIWLHNEATAWQIASTGKIAILLAAVQLRDDVRKVDRNLVTTPTEFDDLFSMSKLWQKSGNSGIQQIASGAPPRISTIFDFNQTPLDFIGADKTLDKQKLHNNPGEFMAWRDIKDRTFWELLWLMGTQSNNTAATACLSEIGVAYVKAVQRAYGLFDEATVMRMLLSSGYGRVKEVKVNKRANSPIVRQLRNKETQPVRNVLWLKNHRTGEKEPAFRSTQSGSAAALTAYMIALMQNKFIDKAACDTIRKHLGGEQFTFTSFISLGVQGAGSTVDKEYSKIGILKAINCEFTYLESEGRQYAVVVTGILDKKVGSQEFGRADLSLALGREIHLALTAT